MKLSRVSIPYRAFGSSLKILVAAMFLFGGAFGEMSLSALFGAVIIFFAVVITSIGYSYLYWKNFDYFFEGDSLKISHGIIRKNEREIPVSRIQNADVKRNLIHRVLGIGVVSLETAGGNATEASLKYVDLEKSNEIKKKIREFKKASKKEDNEEVETEEDERELLYSIKDSELGLLGVTSVNSGLLFALFALIGFSAPSLTSTVEGSGVALYIAIATIFIVGLLLVTVSNFITTVSRFYDFKLYREKDTLEYERGLFNRAEGSIPLNKLQRLVITDNPLKRAVDRGSLSIETAGYTASSAQEMELAIPLAKNERINEFVEELEGPEDMHLESIPLRALRRYFTRYIILSTIITLGAVLWTGTFSYIIPLTFILASAAAAYLKWVHTGFLETENHLITRRGFWRRRTIIVPYYRTQNVIMSDTIFQQAWDLSTVTLDIAGTGIMSGDASAVDIDTRRARDLSKDLHEKFQASIDK